MTPDALAAAAVREVVELHEFFGDWLRPDGKPAFGLDRLVQVLADGFRLITPDGRILERNAVIGWIDTARGSRATDFRIEVSDMRPVWQSSEAVLLDYVETQYGLGKTTRRQSSALMAAALTSGAPAAPLGVAWVHLQETWLQSAD